MMKRHLLFILLCVGNAASQAQEIWMIGPMLHINFGGGERPAVSYAIEVSYWNLDQFYYSFDGAIEVEKKKVRLYSELQTGIGFAGMGLGPLLQLDLETNETKVGMQGTAWMSFIAGLDYRRRWLKDERIHGIGLFIKIPAVNYFDGNEDEEASLEYLDILF